MKDTERKKRDEKRSKETRMGRDRPTGQRTNRPTNEGRFTRLKNNERNSRKQNTYAYENVAPIKGVIGSTSVPRWVGVPPVRLPGDRCPWAQNDRIFSRWGWWKAHNGLETFMIQGRPTVEICDFAVLGIHGQ